MSAHDKTQSTVYEYLHAPFQTVHFEIKCH